MINFHWRVRSNLCCQHCTQWRYDRTTSSYFNTSFLCSQIFPGNGKWSKGWVTLRRLHNDPRTMLGRLTMASFIEFLRSTNSFESQEFQNGFQWNIFAMGTSEASEMLQCKSDFQKSPQSSFSVTWSPQSSKSSRLPWSSCNKQKKRNIVIWRSTPPQMSLWNTSTSAQIAGADV